MLSRPLQYDVQILRHSLRDRLEWDLSSPLTPEAFAAQTCKDIGLSGEALPIIATAVRESILNHRRAVLDEGLFGLGEAWGAADEAEQEARQEIEAAKVQKKLAADQTAAVSSESLAAPLDASANVSRVASRSPMPPPPPPASRLSVPLPQADSESGAVTPVVDSLADDTSDATPPPTFEPQVDPRYKLAQAVAEKQRFTERGPRPLTSVWRDWFESKQFGPLLEYISNEDMEKREMEALRATRRQRREAARFTGGGGAGGGSRGETKSSRLHFRMSR